MHLPSHVAGLGDEKVVRVEESVRGKCLVQHRRVLHHLRHLRQAAGPRRPARSASRPGQQRVDAGVELEELLLSRSLRCPPANLPASVSSATPSRQPAPAARAAALACARGSGSGAKAEQGHECEFLKRRWAAGSPCRHSDSTSSTTLPPHLFTASAPSIRLHPHGALAAGSGFQADLLSLEDQS
jgi:hypothetical protein